MSVFAQLIERMSYEYQEKSFGFCFVILGKKVVVTLLNSRVVSP